MAVDYEEGRRLLSYENEAGRQELLAWLFNNRHALLNPDPWRPIEELNCGPKDMWLGTNHSNWEDGEPSEIELCIGMPTEEGVLCQNTGNYIKPGYITHWCRFPTHFRELKGPGQQ